MRRVLIVGANSYIGQKFGQYIELNKNRDIEVSFVHASDGSWREADFSPYDAVMLLSGIVHKKETKDMEQLYYDVNYRLAVEVAKKAKESNVKYFLFMSTAAVYGSQVQCITKDTMPAPTTCYGKSKLMAENAITKLKSEQFLVAVIRPPMVYGDDCKGNYPRLVRLAGLTPVFPEYHNQRSMIHIECLCRFLADLIINEKEGFFLPQDKQYADTCEMVVRIRKGMGKKTLLLRHCNGMIRAMIPRYRIINKMFGDFYYSRD